MPSNNASQWMVDVIAAWASGKTCYAELVTVEPARSDSLKSAHTLATGGNYALKTLSGISGSADGTGGKLTFTEASLTWIGLTTDGSATIKGLAVFERVGASPAASDKRIGFIRATADTTVASCTTASGESELTTTGSFAAISEGDLVTGTGIPSGTFVLDKDGTTALILSKVATASGTITATFKTANPYTPNGADFTFPFPAGLAAKID